MVVAGFAGLAAVIALVGRGGLGRAVRARSMGDESAH
jgi:hypothetical protein